MQISTLPVVAGAASGKRIRCTTELKPVVDQLIRASEKNNYWPTVAVRELRALSSGLIGKKNVYVQPGQKDALGNQLFIVFLPGLKAVLQKWAVDEYCIIEMTLDGNYFEATSDGYRTGLYRVKPEEAQRGTWKAEHVANGRVLAKDSRIVAVADSRSEDVSHAAGITMGNIMPALGRETRSSIRNGGCDLHYTNGTKSFGRLIRYSALTNDQARQSAVLLAETMANAKDLKNIHWVSDHGGSVVLTQAMQILVDRGVTLQHHSIFLQDCKSSPGEAIRLARSLKVTMDESMAHTGWSLRGAVSQRLAARERLHDPDDPFTEAHLNQSWITAVVKISASAGSAAAAAGFFGVTLPMLATVTGVVGIVGTGYGVVQYAAKKMHNRQKV